MSNDNPDIERRPRPGGETAVPSDRIERSAGQAALQALETIATSAEVGAGLYLGKEAIAPVVDKVKDKLGSKGNASKD